MNNAFFSSTMIVFLYIAVLFAIAIWIERRAARGKNFGDNAWVYSLTLAVYCTAWTYYGSVGKAVVSGVLYLPIYLGPTMAIILWWTVLRKFIRVKKQYHTTSIADFISVRYDKSQSVAALATVIALVGSLPYIALQLKAIISTFDIIAFSRGGHTHVVPQIAQSAGVGSIVVVCLILFTILFGVRKLDPTERHQGMMGVLAVTAIVKLLAFVGVGFFVVYFTHFRGFADIAARLQATPVASLIGAGNMEQVTYVKWVSYFILAISAIMFLPRQFHVLVIENSSEKHIRTAMWVFPLYMLILNVFVLPIAVGGILGGHPTTEADSFVLTLPLAHGNYWLALFAFIGGLSAAGGMVIINTMTVATMVSNHLLLPLFGSGKLFDLFRRNLLYLRWIIVAGYISLGYWFECKIGGSYMLVNIGMISFAAALQFAPAIIGGVFWKRANRQGALWGLGGGFLAWFYTLLFPSFVKSGWFPASIITDGPGGISWLNPQSLFGIIALDPLSHGVFWSMVVNIGLYVVMSLYYPQQIREKRIAESFTDTLARDINSEKHGHRTAYIDTAQKKKVARTLLARYFSDSHVNTMVDDYFFQSGLAGKEKISIVELAELSAKIEKTLAGALGAAVAYKAVSESELFSAEESEELSQAYSQIVSNLKIAPEELRAKIDYYQEKESLINRHARELETKIRELEENILQRKRAEEELRQIQLGLEQRVQERTLELTKLNDNLRQHIAERKSVEQALRFSEERFRIAAQKASDFIYEWDISSGKLEWFGSIDEKLGYSQGEFPRTIDAWEKAMYPDDRQQVMAKLKLHLEKRSLYQQEYRMMRKDGSLAFWTDSGTALWDENNKAYKMIGVCTDITANKLAEQELQNKLLELEKFHKFAVDRELKMVELKSKIKEMSAQAGDGTPRKAL